MYFSLQGMRLQFSGQCSKCEKHARYFFLLFIDYRNKNNLTPLSGRQLIKKNIPSHLQIQTAKSIKNPQNHKIYTQDCMIFYTPDDEEEEPPKQQQALPIPKNILENRPPTRSDLIFYEEEDQLQNTHNKQQPQKPTPKVAQEQPKTLTGKPRSLRKISVVQTLTDEQIHPKLTANRNIEEKVAEEPLLSSKIKTEPVENLVNHKKQVKSSIQQRQRPQEPKVQIIKQECKEENKEQKEEDSNENDEQGYGMLPKQPKVSISEQLANLLGSKAGVHKIVMTPVPRGVKLQFLVLRKKETMGSSYYCYLRCAESRFVMATKKQNSVSQTLYEIGHNPDVLQNVSKYPFYLGKVVKALKDDFFKIVDDGRFEFAGHKIQRLLGLVGVTVQVFVYKSARLFTPRVQSNQTKNIEANELGCMSLLGKGGLKRDSDLYSSIPMPKDPNMYSLLQDKMNFMPSNSNFLMERIGFRNDKFKIIFGKMLQNQFRMVVGEGISPMQAFGTALCWLN